jgi:alpha-L-fucosidase
MMRISFFSFRCTAVILLSAFLSLSYKAQSQYLPTWESIDSRPTPRWFTDAKFGIFVCWGLYSVPAWSPKGEYSEWYMYWLKQKAFNGKVYDFHQNKYGPGVEFKDFAPLFKAELWNPDEWADLFQQAGAKYIVFTTKHHSGYTLWPSAEAEKTWGENYNPVKVGPRRDLVGDLTAAVKKKGLKMGLYYSLYEWYHPWYLNDFHDFVTLHFHPQFKDLVTRYEPDMVWADGEWEQTSEAWRTPELLAWLFNEGKNKEVVINDRWGSDTRHKHGGFYTTEYGSGMDNDRHPWEENRGMGYSYGYNRAENLADYRSAQELILMLVDIVSRGGNLCLDVGPAADGQIPVIMQERLMQIGNWLKINGEAIYGTRMCKNPVQWSAGAKPEIKRGEFMVAYNILKETVHPDPGQAVKEIFFTSKDNSLFAIVPRWPGNTLLIKEFRITGHVSRITFLQTGQELKFKIRGRDLLIEMPRFDPNGNWATESFVFKMEL